MIELYKKSKGQADVESRLKALGKGIGDVTVNILLRELRGIWNVEPLPSRFTIMAANNLGLIEAEDPAKALIELKKFWKKNGVKGKSFVNFENALLRFGKNYCKKEKCKFCIFNKDFCKISH